ncbi:ATP-binding protein [Paenibacillus piscarius]|uniref:hybrid sensor histidine kinase/response regulator n=1 Tax=Paenibacillus piscarius TaxID=1089681 RepID=UPI001EE7D4EC|nr:ATP-binding protein [Paenibacillus piscarius]
MSILLGLQGVWQHIFAFPQQPRAIQGSLDLRGWNFKNTHSLVLDGEWAFYPDRLASDSDIRSGTAGAPVMLGVPGNWKNALSGSSLGYGTFALRILIDQPLDEPYAFWAQQIQASSRIEVNGHVLRTMGQPGTRKELYQPKAVPYSAHYLPPQGTQELLVLIQAANYEHGEKGGISYSMRLGAQSSVLKERWYSTAFQLTTIIILLLHALYVCILYLLAHKNRILVLFALMLVMISVTVAVDNDVLLSLVLPLSYTWGIKFKLLSYVWMVFLMLLLTYRFHGVQRAGRAVQVYGLLLVLYTLSIAVLPVHIILSWATLPFNLLYMLPPCWMFVIFARMVYQRKKDVAFLTFTACCLISGVVWGATVNNYHKNLPYYPVDILAAIVGFSAYGMKQYIRRSEENVRLNEQLVQADRQKDRFLINTSHELRTPLHGMMSIAESQYDKRRAASADEDSRDMELLLRIGRQMSQLLDDLLDLTLLRENRMVLHPVPLSVAKTASGVADMLRHLAEGRNLTLLVSASDSLPPVWADEKRLIQILFNLIHNALKFTESGSVAVSAKESGGQLLVSVSDTGAGISEEDLARILLPYEQAGGQDRGGLGLGLSITRQLVELHGGSLSVQSKPGAGSTFSFSLPLADHASLTARRTADHTGPAETAELPELSAAQDLPFRNGDTAPFPAGVPPPLTGGGGEHEGDVLHILAVDDDPVNLRVLASILHEEHFRLTPVLSGEEALKRLEEESWDLLITDVMMPHMSGYELTRRVREQYSMSELPVLLLTARAMREEVYYGFGQGANDYVTKPVDSLELKYRVTGLARLKQTLHHSLRLEMAYLQAQIRPHFLFNALNSISTLSEIDICQMKELIDAFSSYLRSSFDLMNTGKLVNIQQELSLVRAYLYIEKVRFGERLEVLWQLDFSGVLLIPPLILQPLVENAVRHGLLSQVAGGTLTVRIEDQGDQVLFEVQDDGKGMEQAQIDSLLKKNKDTAAGIGLWNTNRRLTERYGQGLSIQSRPGYGTTVSFIVPFRRGE